MHHDNFGNPEDNGSFSHVSDLSFVSKNDDPHPEEEKEEAP